MPRPIPQPDRTLPRRSHAPRHGTGNASPPPAELETPSEIRNPQSQIPNPQSPIPNPQSSGRQQPAPRIARWWFCLRLCTGYTGYFLTKGLFLVVTTPLLLILLPFPNATHRLLGFITHHYLAWLSRWFLPALGIYDVAEISGADAARSLQPCIFVANHRSRMDGPFLLGLLQRTGVVIKAKEGKQLTFALLMRSFDYVGIDPERLSSVARALDQARAILSAGRSLLVFPEGTRAPSGRLQTFRKFAFQLALETGVPIVPAVVHSLHPFMGRIPGSYFPPGRNVYRVRFLDPIRPAPDDDAETLNAESFRRVARELRTLDAGTIWETRRPTPPRT